jgi:aspartyl-tRNA(Asn)/glutamyl-tRNA(Gln) amidotransferase subunit C
VIDREQVLHVARLARLDLAEEEVERYARELSSVLGYIETISELDLDEVEPTSHVVDVVNRLRADEARPSLPPEVALAGAPDPAEGGFRVPSPSREAV